jgi:hypothetical protein
MSDDLKPRVEVAVKIASGAYRDVTVISVG